MPCPVLALPALHPDARQPSGQVEMHPCRYPSKIHVSSMRPDSIGHPSPPLHPPCSPTQATSGRGLLPVLHTRTHRHVLRRAIPSPCPPTRRSHATGDNHVPFAPARTCAARGHPAYPAPGPYEARGQVEPQVLRNARLVAAPVGGVGAAGDGQGNQSLSKARW